MQAKYMTDEHIMFRDSVREFIKRDIAPYHEQWEKDEIVPRDIWLKAGENGFLWALQEFVPKVTLTSQKTFDLSFVILIHLSFWGFLGGLRCISITNDKFENKILKSLFVYGCARRVWGDGH